MPLPATGSGMANPCFSVAEQPACGQECLERLKCDMAATSSPPPHDRDTDVSQLATDARDGNRFAFQQLVTILEPKIFRMIFYRTRSREDAEDICQDVFLKAFCSLKKLQQPERYESWL